jgi:hypothetical protein
MPGVERALALLLRFSGVLLLTALGAVVMPHAWMAAIHRGLGMGDLPDVPIIGYLTRSASALYAAHGALVFYVSLDVRRYLRLVQVLAAISLVFGAVLLVVDVAVGMPLGWTIGEGPFVMALGAVLLVLARRVERS